MKAIRHKVFGRLFIDKAYAALWLPDDSDTSSESIENADIIYLRYALTLRGTEQPLFPAFALDDWGNEYNRLALYRWLRQEGERFPRAEVFGFDGEGTETQHFLREIELHWQYPLFAYPTKETPINEGILLSTVFMTNEQIATPQMLTSRPTYKPPLRNARVQWWQASSNWMRESFDFSILDQ